MKLVNVYLTVVVLLLSLHSFAQKRNKEPDKPQFKRLYIGDTVPMELIVFNNVRNYPGGKAKLSDFKGKYIILDFWSKYCSSCIAAFPHMEELQHQFKDKIQVLLVTHDTEGELGSLLRNSKNVKETRLPMIIGEQILTKQLFPNESVPYHVWINRDGKVIATTYEAETTAENLRDFIIDKPLNLLIKNDLAISNSLEKDIKDERKSLLKIGDGLFLGYVKYFAQLPKPKLKNALPDVQLTLTNQPYYSAFMSRLLEYNSSNFTMWNFIDEATNQTKGFKALNMPILDYYRFAFADGQTRFLGNIVADEKAKLMMEDITDTTNTKRHLINNTYCYESSLTNYNYETAKKILQQDLIRFFGMNASLEDRELKCVVLTRLGTSLERKLWSSNQDPKFKDMNLQQVTYKANTVILKNTYVSYIALYMGIHNKSFDDPVIIDETNFNSEDRNKFIDIKLDCSLKLTSKNIPILRDELARFGLGLREETRKMRVMVLKSVF